MAFGQTPRLTVLQIVLLYQRHVDYVRKFSRNVKRQSDPKSLGVTDNTTYIAVRQRDGRHRRDGQKLSLKSGWLFGTVVHCAVGTRARSLTNWKNTRRGRRP